MGACCVCNNTVHSKGIEEQTLLRNGLEEKTTTAHSVIFSKGVKQTPIERQLSRMNSERARANLALLGERRSTQGDPHISTSAQIETRRNKDSTKTQAPSTTKLDKLDREEDHGTLIKSLQDVGGIVSHSLVDPSLRESEQLRVQRRNKPTSTILKIGPEIFVSLKTDAIEDQYKIGQEIGEGSFGKVILATHKATGIVRAMKTINKKFVHNNDEEKFFAEVNTLRDLDHPNILKLYELYQDEQNYYLIMEYLNGGELFERIQQMHNFSENQAAIYMKQILSAVVYLHEKRIVHRDLKPENLLLDSKKHDASLKLIDFGTAQKFEPGVKLTQKHGTPYYIAPEVINKSYDEKCDVWSCGVIMYILLCGYPPFNAKTDPEILEKIKIGKFGFDEADWAKISPEAKNLITRMLTYKPEDRISAREALNHVWFQKNFKEHPLNVKVLENLRQFQSHTQLKQAILTLIVTQISTHQEKAELQKTFQQLDKDGNGLLTKEEFIEGYAKVFGKSEVSKAEALRIFEEVDINGSGEIDYSEFVIASMNKDKLLSTQKMAQAFSMFDQNGDGYITRDELEAVMGGVNLPAEDWIQIIEEVDTNKDGKISKEEFIELLQKSTTSARPSIS